MGVPDIYIIPGYSRVLKIKESALGAHQKWRFFMGMPDIYIILSKFMG